MKLLKEDRTLLTVGLRSRKILRKVFSERKSMSRKDGEKFYEVRDEIFTYNPGLRRKSDNDLFGSHEKLKDKLYEIELSKFYKERNYRTIYFKEKYVEHIGDKRHVHFSRKGKNSVLDFKIDRMIKKIRYTFLKLFGKVK